MLSPTLPMDFTTVFRKLLPLFLACGIGNAEEVDPFDAAAEAALEAESNGGIFFKPGEVKNLTEKIKPALVTVRQIGRDGNRRGIGAGFVIDESGLIATNLHVIGEGRPVEVEFEDGVVFPVTEVRAWDRNYDLAVLQIDSGKRKLSALELGDSAGLEQGQLIVGYGAPLGLEFTVAPGVVSAIRKLDPGFLDETPDYEMIQISMPIEQGNSGGPIVDLDGKVMGVVTLRHRLRDNLGFAVKSSDLLPLLDEPNPVPMTRWKTIGTLDPRQWSVVMDGDWTQRGGVIFASNMGTGFGGRTLCLSEKAVPEGPYEVAVKVKLDDESGAAGLAFSADGGDRHYGFYPSNGNLRLTRFDGPDVYSWEILEQLDVPAYQPGEWNRLRIRVDGNRITGYVNGVEALSLIDNGLRGGRAGLCKFRKTEAEFREFRVGENLETPSFSGDEMKKLNLGIESFIEKRDRAELLDAFPGDHLASAKFLEEKAREFEALAEEMRGIKNDLHHREVSGGLTAALGEREVDLFEVAIQISRIDDPELDVDHYRSVFQRLVDDASEFVGDAAEKKGLRKLSAFLFEENGFHGSRNEYYHHSNSYINHVIDDREGLPITLSVLYIEMARRLGFEGIFGVALPGQFLVGYRPDESADLLLINPFQEGKEMTRSDAELLANGFGSRTSDATFAPSPPSEIAARMLRNLIGLEIDRKMNPPGALGYLNLLLAVNADDGYARFQRAIVQAQLEKIDGAKEDLDWLLEKRPIGIDYRRLEQFRAALE